MMETLQIQNPNIIITSSVIELARPDTETMGAIAGDIGALVLPTVTEATAATSSPPEIAAQAPHSTEAPTADNEPFDDSAEARTSGDFHSRFTTQAVRNGGYTSDGIWKPIVQFADGRI